MLDDNWETITGPIAHQIELINAVNQINVLDGLILFLLAHRGPAGNGQPPMPDEVALCHLHHAGTLFLLAEPGCYRNTAVVVKDSAGVVMHTPPAWQSVKAAMQHFFRDLSSVWSTGDALDVAAYALWRINWVHPFLNGNGRTARAFAYACLSVKLDVILPGTVTLIDQIMANRPQYQDALREADKSPQQPNLAPMKAFLDGLLQNQIASTPQTP